jgi:putative GTP pyrophosphokinase
LPESKPSVEERALVESLVEHYKQNRVLISRFLQSLHAHISESLNEGGPLFGLVHSVKHRLKDPEHLRDKLYRKLDKAKQDGSMFDINTDNLVLKVNDLGGYRILHLHTTQAEQIHKILIELFEVANFDLYEPPYANVWDEESRSFFDKIGIKTEVNPRMYSSVHYVLKPRGKSGATLEVQVRTLADEIWGEVDHKINYPHPHGSRGCREQIRVLARVASSCSRLVDSIMVADSEWDAQSPLVASGEGLIACQVEGIDGLEVVSQSEEGTPPISSSI